MNKILDKLGFDKRTLITFLVIVTNSQLIYSTNIQNGALYEPFREALGVTNTELGILLSITGFIGMYGNIAFGWLQDRFSCRSVLSVNSFLFGSAAIFLAVTPQQPFWSLMLVYVGFGLFGEALYWPSVLKSVRATASETNQATAFGFMESIRGMWAFITASISLAIFTMLGSTTFGLKVSLGVMGLIVLASAISVWFCVPEEQLIKSEHKNKIAFTGLIKAAKMPEVWLTGIGAGCIYATFIALNTYFVPYLQNVYLLPITLAGVFAIVNSTAIKFIIAPVSGLVADLKFKSSAHLMRVGFLALVVLFGITIMIPKSPSLVIPTMIVLMLVTVACYFVRSIYYAPIGEMEVPVEMGAAAMSVAAFIGYSPNFWAPPAFGYMIDKFGNETAYTIIFSLLVVLSIVGAITNTMVGKKIVKIRAAKAVKE